MQRGLDAMAAQRREEESHMARATRVRPQKHPQGECARGAGGRGREQ